MIALTPGRRRLPFCAAGLHRMTPANRRLKYWIRKDGIASLLSNGCRRCAAEGSSRYRERNAVAVKLRRMGVAA